MPLHELNSQQPQILHHPNPIDAFRYHARARFFSHLDQFADGGGTFLLGDMPGETPFQLYVFRGEIRNGLKRTDTRADTRTAQGESESVALEIFTETVRVDRVPREVRLQNLEYHVPGLHACTEDSFAHRAQIDFRIADRRRNQVDKIQALPRLPGCRANSRVNSIAAGRVRNDAIVSEDPVFKSIDNRLKPDRLKAGFRARPTPSKALSCRDQVLFRAEQSVLA